MDNKKRLIIMSVTGVLILICGIVGVAYAWFSTIVEGEGKEIKVQAGMLDVKYTDTTVINVTNAAPIYDSQKADKAYKNVFSISHNEASTLDACYEIEMIVDSIQDKFKSEFLKWELFSTDSNSVVASGDFSDAVVGSEYLVKANTSLPNDAVHNYEFRVWLSYSETVDQTELLQNNSGTALSVHFKVTSTNGSCKTLSFYEKVLMDNPNVATRETFDEIFTESNNGNTIYKETYTQDETEYTTHYFAGNVTNNYVKFGTYGETTYRGYYESGNAYKVFNTLEECESDTSYNSNCTVHYEEGNDIFWRIVRVNEDNSVRLIYAGTSVDDKYGSIRMNRSFGESIYGSDSRESINYAIVEDNGDIYESEAKKAIDTWYSNNLLNNDAYISKTAVYCNDRTYEFDNGVYSYNSGIRLESYLPSYVCSENDAFTASSNVGNGELFDSEGNARPIALITADEMAYAGGVFGKSNTNYYLYDNYNIESWLTMSPHSSVIAEGYTSLLGVKNDQLSYIHAGEGSSIRPVISLKSCVQWSGGNGTVNSPYEVSLDVNGSCTTSEN